MTNDTQINNSDTANETVASFTEIVADNQKKINENSSNKQARLTLITSNNPERLTKKFSLNELEELTKEPGGNLIEGWAEERKVSTLEELQNLIVNLKTNQALTYGLPDNLPISITTKKNYENSGRSPLHIPRAKEFFHWLDAPGILMLDYDPPDDGKTLDSDGLVNVLKESVPGLDNVKMFVIPSSSSHIFNKDSATDLTGLRGQRIYLLISNAQMIPEVGNRIVTYLWAAGYGYIKISGSGSQLERTIVDANVWQPERLDFAAGAHCVEPLEQKRGNGKIYSGISDFLDGDAVPPPDEKTQQAAKEKITKAKQDTEKDAAEVKERWIENKVDIIQKETGKTKEESRAVAVRAVEGEELFSHYVVIIKGSDGGEVGIRVGDLLASPDKYDGVEALDPLEPEYNERKWVAKVYLKGNTPNINSFAHGKKTYRLNGQSPPPENPPDEKQLLSKVEEENDDPPWVGEFNKKHAVVHQGKTYVLTEKYDPILERETYSLEPVSSFNNWYKHHKDEDGKGISSQWLSHKNRREYPGGIVFDPRKEGHYDGYYNLFQGFPVNPIPGDCSLFWRLVKEALCAEKDKIYQYVRKWLAHLIQRPWELAEVALAFRGLQGTGKGTVVRYLSRLLARYYLELTQMDQVVGRFNSHMKDIILVNANEAVWGGKKSEVGALKAMITDPLQAIEQKGVDIYSVRNCKRLIVSSNEDWIVPMDIDDRRFVVVDVNPKFKGDVEFFKELAEQMDNGGLEALMYDLLHEDIEGWHPREKPPSIDGFDLKLRSMKTPIRWLYHCLENEIYKDDAGLDNTWPLSKVFAVSKYKYYKEYEVFCEGKRIKVDDERLFWKSIKDVLGALDEYRQPTSICPKRSRVVTLPSLEDARKKFAAFAGEEEEKLWG